MAVVATRTRWPVEAVDVAGGLRATFDMALCLVDCGCSLPQSGGQVTPEEI